MARPVNRDAYASALVNLRELLMAARATTDGKEILGKVFGAIEAHAEITENVIRSIGVAEDKLEIWQATVQSSRNLRQLSESKCVSNLKSLGSDKSEFKAWNDKLINAFAQTLGSPWRRFMRNLNKALDQDRKVLTVAELNISKA